MSLAWIPLDQFGMKLVYVLIGFAIFFAVLAVFHTINLAKYTAAKKEWEKLSPVQQRIVRAYYINQGKSLYDFML